ncbi:hypothetical protein L9F63_019566 [Diploptera punctata]|uniref:Transmembrane protein 14C n=1 Tax=Diploptera punctata TaxID=6984 RepID=A0AAD7ZVC4_DIPPU|nr:hypothetical protein L9F63_019566 [Diploptera punctata]
MTIDLLSFAYAATVATGGIIGYTKAGSIPSLGAGLLFGSILCYGAIQTSRDPNNFGLLFGTSAALGGLMGYRFYNSGKFMPAGIVTVLSVGMVLRFAARSAGLLQSKPVE